SAKALSPLLHGKHCVAVGPGLGRGDQVFAALTPLLDWHGAQIWDADALFALATHPNIKISHLYMTPHPGEAAQLLNVTPSDITKAYMRTAQVLQERFGGSVLLKGATTVITDGVHRGFSVRGCPGMAKGGSGDILTGLCAAMICQGLYGFEAFMTAAYLHGSAGERAAVQCSERTMTALDLIAALR
ncbi:MAG: ADP/ATP-dependent (S)-NAD(P)H-hydrate dehydratase, partial [Clostridia bacterium]